MTDLGALIAISATRRLLWLLVSALALGVVLGLALSWAVPLAWLRAA